MYKRQSLGRPILGSRETVSAFTREDVVNHWSSNYTSERVVVSAAGNIDHNKVVKLVERKLKLPGANGPLQRTLNDCVQSTSDFVRRKDIVQAHICLGTRSIRFADDRRFALTLMNSVLGSGMSSRLFQRVREKNGLAYTIYSFNESLSDSGMIGIYAATEEKQVEKALRLIHQEIDKIADKPLSTTEIKRAKNQLKGALMLGQESISNRMHRLARGEIYMEQYTPLDELVERIDAVTAADIMQIAQDLFSQPFYTARLLPLESGATG